MSPVTMLTYNSLNIMASMGVLENAIYSRLCLRCKIIYIRLMHDHVFTDVVVLFAKVYVYVYDSYSGVCNRISTCKVVAFHISP